MENITREQVLDNLEDVKKYIEEAKNKKEKKVVGLEIKNRWTGDIIFTSTKTTWKEAVEEADLREADLCGADLCGADLRGADLREADLCEADLCGADLRGAELNRAKFYGKGGHKKLTKEQVPVFLTALGFDIE